MRMEFKGVSGFFRNVGRKIKREDWFVHSNNKYSLHVRRPPSLIPGLVVSSNDYYIKLFQKGCSNPIENYTVPEHSVDYMIGLIGKRLCE